MDEGKGGGLVPVLLAPRFLRVPWMPRQMTYPDKDKHKAPASTHPRTLSLQGAGVLPFSNLIVIIHHRPLRPTVCAPYLLIPELN